MSEAAAARIAGQLDVDDDLALAVRDDDRAPAPPAVRGELDPA